MEHFWFFQKWNGDTGDTGYRYGFPQMMPTLVLKHGPTKNPPKKHSCKHTHASASVLKIHWAKLPCAHIFGKFPSPLASAEDIQGICHPSPQEWSCYVLQSDIIPSIEISGRCTKEALLSKKQETFSNLFKSFFSFGAPVLRPKWIESFVFSWQIGFICHQFPAFSDFMFVSHGRRGTISLPPWEDFGVEEVQQFVSLSISKDLKSDPRKIKIFYASLC